nr:hypothetical protein [Tanacetum cinerariifolium]
MFSTINLVSRHQNTQQFGALLPIELTNDEIRNSKAYKEYYAIATGEAAPKPKASVRRTRKAQQLKLVTKRSMQQKHISQPSGSGVDKGTGSKPEVPDVPTDESEKELSWNSTNDEGDDHEEQDDDDSADEGDGEEDLGLNIGEEERHDEEEEEEELYRDVNINQGMGLPASLEVEDSHVTLTPVKPDGQQESSLVSSQFVTSLLNPTLDTNKSVCWRVSSIPRIVNHYMDQRMNEAVKVVIQIQSDQLRDETKRENDEFLRTVDENIKKIIKEQVKEQVKAQVFKILPRIKQAVNEQLEAEVLTRSSRSSRTSYVVAVDLFEMELKKILIEKMEGNKFIQRSDEQRNLYKALVDAYESDKIILDTYRETATLKRRCDDDEDKDNEPFVGPDRGSMRRREGKEPESASAPSETITRSAGRSTIGSRSRQASASESALAEEPVQTTSPMEEPSHPEFDTGADDQPIVQSSQHPECELANQADTRSSFNELMDTPLDFSNFLMNRLRVDTLTPELLAGPTYELMKGSCKSLIELEYHLEELYKATRRSTIEDLVPKTMWIHEPIDYDKHALWGVSHWGRKRHQFYGFTVNQEFARDVYSKRRISAVTELKIVEWHSYKHLDWIIVRRDDDKLYKFKEGDFKRLCIQDIKDMLLLLIQGKLTNLTVEERFAFNVSLSMFTRSIVIQQRMEDLQLGVESYQKRLNLTKPDTYRSDLKCKEAYNAYSNLRGFIYQNKDKKNRLMRIDELHKFSDGTLIDVRTALDDRLK